MSAITEETMDYRKRFKAYYYDKIANELASFEAYRTPQMVIYYFYIFMIILTIAIAIGWVLSIGKTMPPGFWDRSGDGNFIIYGVFGICSGFWFLANKVKKNFEIKVKKGVIESFLAFFGDFKWMPRESLPREEIEQSKLIGLITDLKADDYFQGTHKGLKFVISEFKTWRGRGKQRHQTFGGIFVKIDMNKKIQGHTIVTEELSVAKQLTTFNKFPLCGVDSSGLEKVELEDIEFNKMFKVYSTDQVESRYILTTTFMERLKNLKEIYKVCQIKASFFDDSILIAMGCQRDMFLLGDLNIPVTDTGEVQELFDEFISVLSLVDLLHLDSKTGL